MLTSQIVSVTLGGGVRVQPIKEANLSKSIVPATCSFHFCVCDNDQLHEGLWRHTEATAVQRQGVEAKLVAHKGYTSGQVSNFQQTVR